MVVPETESMFAVIAEVISPVISRGRLPPSSVLALHN